MTKPPELRFFNTGEVALHYARWHSESQQAGPAYVFIHGITDLHQTWRWVVDDVRRGGDAVAVDLRGHYRSGRSPSPYQFQNYPRDVVSLIEGLGIGPAIIVGHSLGALTAIQIAANRPDLAAAIVLEDPPLYGAAIMKDYPERRHRFERNAALSGSGMSLMGIANAIRSDNPGADERVIQEGALALFRTDHRVISDATSDETLNWVDEAEERMRSIRCPALVIQGVFEHGGWMREEDGRRALELIPDCTLEKWDEFGHSLHINDSERFTAQVNEFVAGLKTLNETP